MDEQARRAILLLAAAIKDIPEVGESVRRKVDEALGAIEPASVYEMGSKVDLNHEGLGGASTAGAE